MWEGKHLLNEGSWKESSSIGSQHPVSGFNQKSEKYGRRERGRVRALQREGERERDGGRERIGVKVQCLDQA